MTSYHCAQALLPDGLATDVTIDTAGDVITRVTVGIRPPPGARRLSGLVLPGFANAHSHAFHRALRGRSQGRGTFWSWRREMYAVAARLSPESYYALARAVYAEMALAGFTTVGEFHYLHHQVDGSAYADPNAMSAALVVAAADAGIRITLLDACYLSGGFGAPLAPEQGLFGDADVAAWAARADAFRPAGRQARTGAAIHSVRAVPADAIAVVAATSAGPLHVHLSEQRAENDGCQAVHGVSPTRLLADNGALGERTTVVHGIHLSDDDVSVLGSSGAGVCFCPSTERELADGLAPVAEVRAAGAPTCLGTDCHASIDPFAEMRGLEYGERLRRQRRGNLGTAELLAAATAAGHAALGWPEAGELRAGAIADLVAISADDVRRAGGDELDGVVFTATAADVTDVIVSGRAVVRDSRHLLVDDVATEMHAAIAEVAR